VSAALTLDVLRYLSSGTLLAALSVLCLLGASQVWHLVQYIRFWAKGMAAEAALLSQRLPPDERLPHVLVQVPTMNERLVVCRISEAIAKLEWPRDRLRIQVLDDSTDTACVEIARGAVASLRQQGIDAELLHRTDRGGFKGAAMQAGLQHSTDEYVAVFDVDFIPPPDFLRRCLAILVADPRLAFVQARWDATNINDNALTRAQQRVLDLAFALDAARCWSGHFVIFHGSGAVWRRAAVDELGGWTSDLLSEDLDISYRALVGGWDAKALMTVAVPGELPNTNAAWMKQQYRWSGGVAETLRKWLPLIWRSKLTPARKLIASIPLVYSIFGPTLGIAVVAAAVEALLRGGLDDVWAWTLAGVAGTETLFGVFGMALASQRFLRGTSPWSEWPHLLIGFGFFAFTQLRVLRSVLDALLGKAVIWIPTPKQSR
jgi:cellulose synthase/poly-beta-1,6-N-acetylglucosamine synthase-like glycosyltransferase